MSTKLYSHLLESLIKFDFLLIKKSPIESRNLKKYLRLNSLTQKGVFLLDPSQCIKTVKIFIRLLFFLKNQKGNLLTLKFKDDSFFDLVKVLLKNKSALLNKVVLTKDVKFTSKSHTNLIVSFGSQITCSSYEDFFRKNVYLFAEFNTFFTRADFGSYKAFSDMDDWKKYVFFVLLLKQIYFIK
jgi:hypothetical protein